MKGQIRDLASTASAYKQQLASTADRHAFRCRELEAERDCALSDVASARADADRLAKRLRALERGGARERKSGGAELAEVAAALADAEAEKDRAVAEAMEMEAQVDEALQMAEQTQGYADERARALPEAVAGRKRAEADATRLRHALGAAEQREREVSAALDAASGEGKADRVKAERMSGQLREMESLAGMMSELERCADMEAERARQFQRKALRLEADAKRWRANEAGLRRQLKAAQSDKADSVARCDRMQTVLDEERRQVRLDTSRREKLRAGQEKLLKQRSLAIVDLQVRIADTEGAHERAERTKTEALGLARDAQAEIEQLDADLTSAQMQSDGWRKQLAAVLQSLEVLRSDGILPTSVDEALLSTAERIMTSSGLSPARPTARPVAQKMEAPASAEDEPADISDASVLLYTPSAAPAGGLLAQIDAQSSASASAYMNTDAYKAAAALVEEPSGFRLTVRSAVQETTVRSPFALASQSQLLNDTALVRDGVDELTAHVEARINESRDFLANIAKEDSVLPPSPEQPKSSGFSEFAAVAPMPTEDPAQAQEDEEEFEEELGFDEMCDLEVAEISGSGFGFQPERAERPSDPLAATLHHLMDTPIEEEAELSAPDIAPMDAARPVAVRPVPSPSSGILSTPVRQFAEPTSKAAGVPAPAARRQLVAPAAPAEPVAELQAALQANDGAAEDANGSDSDDGSEWASCSSGEEEAELAELAQSAAAKPRYDPSKHGWSYTAAAKPYPQSSTVAEASDDEGLASTSIMMDQLKQLEDAVILDQSTESFGSDVGESEPSTPHPAEEEDELQSTLRQIEELRAQYEQTKATLELRTTARPASATLATPQQARPPAPIAQEAAKPAERRAVISKPAAKATTKIAVKPAFAVFDEGTGVTGVTRVKQGAVRAGGVQADTKRSKSKAKPTIVLRENVSFGSKATRAKPRPKQKRFALAAGKGAPAKPARKSSHMLSMR